MHRSCALLLRQLVGNPPCVLHGEQDGRQVVRVNRRGRQDGGPANDLTLAMREWQQCKGCGTILDLDINAAVNLEQAANSTVSGYGRLVRRPDFATGATTVEVSTHLGTAISTDFADFSKC